jgi:AcrR family transcriptional regulator
MTPSGTAAPDGRRLGRAERREAIIGGAASAFARAGYSGTSMADISRSAGVSHLIVYRHFESKEVLYEAVLERALDGLDAALSADAAVGPHGPRPAVLLQAARADPAAFEVLWRHATRERGFARWVARARELLQNTTETALGPHVEGRYLRWATRATVAYLVEAVLAWVEDGDPELDARFVAATDAALRAGVRSWAHAS